MYLNSKYPFKRKRIRINDISKSILMLLNSLINAFRSNVYMND